MRSQNLPDGNHPSPSSEHSTQSRSVAWSAWSLAMVVLAITVAGGTLHLRVHLREHLAQRDGEILATVALARQYANGSGATLTQRLGNPADQLALALEISRSKAFSASGCLIAMVILKRLFHLRSWPAIFR